MKAVTSSSRTSAPAGRRDGARGFTLIEMLVAITLLAVMAVIAWRGLDAMTRGSERLTDHDARLNALKLLYGQFQTDCEHLADPAALQASPLEFSPGQLLLVRDRRDEGRPATWQVIAYRLDGNTVVRAAAAPAQSRQAVQSALLALRQAEATAGGVARPLVVNADQLFGRAWVEPTGWLADTGRLRAALPILPAGVRAETDASAPPADNAAIGARAGVVRAVELTISARMGDGDMPRRYQKVCMTGL
jgi:general secretion pathway protein J